MIMRLFSWFRRRLFLLCASMTIFVLWFVLMRSDFNDVNERPFFNQKKEERSKEERIAFYEAHLLQRGFTDEQIGNMSPLGKWLLAPEGSPPPAKETDKNYSILIWQHGKFLERRHIRRFSNKKFSPWEQCSVQNCVLSYDKKKLQQADAVVFHLQRTWNMSQLPMRNRTDQRWIFLTDESPMHIFFNINQQLSDYDGLFNWSMTYRMNSDVPVPYGRTVWQQMPDNAFPHNSSQLFERYWRNNIMTHKNKLVAVMGSNCHAKNERWSYVKTLKELLHDDLDIIGTCLRGNTTICPGHFDKDCLILNAYKFYLSFENSNCREYLTEKVFWNAYHKFAVPVIMGSPKMDCQRLLPPHSFLHMDDFANVNELANYLTYLDRDNEKYLQYHEWRLHYKVINEHGYFGSPSMHYCRICEALNYNPITSKVYKRLENFWNKKRDCAPFISSSLGYSSLSKKYR